MHQVQNSKIYYLSIEYCSLNSLQIFLHIFEKRILQDHLGHLKYHTKREIDSQSLSFSFLTLGNGINVIFFYFFGWVKEENKTLKQQVTKEPKCHLATNHWRINVMRTIYPFPVLSKRLLSYSAKKKKRGCCPVYDNINFG